MVKYIRYPMPKEMIDKIEKERINLALKFKVRNIPKTKFVKKYVKITFLTPDEIKKLFK